MAFVTGSNIGSDQEIKGWKFAVRSGILGWVLDAFDFFVVVFLFDTLAARFHVSKASVVYTLTLTLAMRPLGALFFGALADRFGRKRPLMFCVLYFSLCTVFTGLAPTFWMFVALSRAVRHWYGRLLGHRRLLRYGKFAASLSRRALRHDPGGISHGLSVGFGSDADALLRSLAGGRSSLSARRSHCWLSRSRCSRRSPKHGSSIGRRR